MSPIGRIFSVINLFLAAFFLAWASMNLATSQEFKKKYEDEVVAKNELEARLEKEKSDIQVALDTKATTLDLVMTERDQAQQEAKRNQGSYDEEVRQNGELRSSVERFSQSQESLQEQLRTQTDLRAQAVDAKNDADNRADESLAAQQVAETTQQELTAENDSLKNTISELEMQLVARGDTIANLETQIAQIVEYTNIDVSKVIAQPKIDGTVVEAVYDISPGLVAINRGRNHGVQRGFTFDIFNGPQYKGQVRVENVRDDMCTCLILRPVDGQVISQGDNASTVL